MTAQRLSALDASFLTLESPATPMQAGGLGVFEPGLEFAGVVEALRARIHLVPLARKRLQDVPLGGTPVWVDDTDFDLSFHLRHAALPAPGDRRQLGEFLSRLMSRPLDRSRPLWELYVLEGLEGGRTGLFRKVHLAVAGTPNSDLFAALLDDRADAPDPDPPAQGWRPGEPPGQAGLAAEALGDWVGRLAVAGQGLRHAAVAPRRMLGAAASAATSAVGVAVRLARSAPPSPLNARLSPQRRFVTVRADLEDLRAVRRQFGGSIHDVVVAVVGDAVGRQLRSRGYDTTDLDLRVMVPVRVSGGARGGAAGGVPVLGDGGAAGQARVVGEAPAGDAGTLGDGVVAVLAPLPVMEMDPVARLYRVMGELAAIRESRQAVAAGDLMRLAGYGPAMLHALAARVASAEARYNLALSNAPGPQSPRYLRGVRMEESYPFIPLAGDAALSVAVSSYAGGVFFGLLGDRFAVPDLDVLAAGVGEAIADLAGAAQRERARGSLR